jgi:predicted phage tail protein
MITVYFPKYIRSLTENISEHKFDVETIGDLIQGLRVLFPKLSLYLSQIDSGQVNNVCYFVDKVSETTLTSTLTSKPKVSELVLIITIYGQGEDFGSILMGAALIAAGFVLGPEVSLIGISGFLTGGQIAMMGLSLVLSGFLALLRPQSQTAPHAPTDAPIRAQNDAFGAFQNTTSTDTAVPLIFGQMRVPGQFIGGRIRTIQHDSGTVISVANYV